MRKLVIMNNMRALIVSRNINPRASMTKGAMFTFLFMSLFHQTWADTKIYTWSSGTNAGRTAATCMNIWPTNRPFQVPMTLVVDNNIPTGTILHSWSYNDFLPNFTELCSTAISNSTANVSSGGATGNVVFDSRLNFNPASPPVNGIFPTSIDGIGIRLYVSTDTTIWNDYYNVPYGYLQLWLNNSPEYGMVGSEYPVVRNGLDQGIQSYLRTYYTATSPQRYELNGMNRYSIRAELIKTGNITNYGPLMTIFNPSWTAGTSSVLLSPTSAPRDLFSGNAINIVAPTCQLKTVDHYVQMGTWESRSLTQSGSAVRGPYVPLNLELECSASVSDAKFRFADSGLSPSAASEQNVTLYDANNNKVEGLEVELRYNGERINIDGLTEISTGGHGTARVVPPGQNIFSVASSVHFTANYIQTSNIKVSNNNFTGSTKGKVNLWITYN